MNPLELFDPAFEFMQEYWILIVVGAAALGVIVLLLVWTGLL